MQYIGIDIHKQYGVYTTVGEDGHTVDQSRIDNNPVLIHEHLNKFNQPLEAAIEATFSWGWLADLLSERKIRVTLAHPQKVKAIASAQIKTDKVDSKILAQLLRADLIPPAYYTPKDVRDQKELLRFRASLVGVKTQTKNRIHSLLAKLNIQDPEGVTDLFGKKGRQFLNGLTLPINSQFALRQYLKLIDQLEAQIHEGNGLIDEQFAGNEQAKLLQQLPGLGRYTSLILAVEIGPIERFGTSKQLCSYAGLVPSIYQSGDHTRYGKIKQGNHYIRWVLLEAVPKAIKKDQRLMDFYLRIADKKGKKKAKVATARKMLAQIYHILKRKEVFKNGDQGSPVFFSETDE